MARKFHGTEVKECLLALLLGIALLPAAASAQAPTYITQWGSLGSGDGQFNQPHRIAADREGNVYVSDYSNYRIQKFTSDGAYLAQWGSFGSGDGQFKGPGGVAADAAGNVYVLDQGNRRIQKFTATGTYLTQWDLPSPGQPQSTYASHIAVDAVGAVYVDYSNADTSIPGIWKFTGTGALITIWGFPQGSWEARGLATDAAGNVYAARYDYVMKFTNDLALLVTQWGTLGYYCEGIAIDADDNVYVSNTENDRMLKFTSGGVPLGEWGSRGSGNGQFDHPSGIAVDPAGNVYVTDTRNHRVQKFGYLPVAAKPTTWGRVKRLYR